MNEPLIDTDITGIFGPGFAKHLNWELRQEVPREKLRHYQIAADRIKYERQCNLIKPHIDGLGEKFLSIPARTYFRWKEVDAHFWEDKKNQDNFYKDNPECRGNVDKI